MKKSNLKNKFVNFEYKLIEKNWQKKLFNFEEYYDYNFCKRNNTIFNKIEMYLDVRDYLYFYNSIIENIRITIEEKNRKVIDNYTYWDNGESQVYEHIKFIDEIKSYRTIISFIKYVSFNLLLRFEEVNNTLILVTNSILDSKKTKTQF